MIKTSKNRIFIFDSSSGEKINTKLILKKICKSNHIFNHKNISQVYNQMNFLQPNLRLADVISMQCNLSKKNFKDFLNLFQLEKQIQQYEHIVIQDIPFELKTLVSIFLYIFANNICIFYNVNLYSIILKVKENEHQEKAFNYSLDESDIIYMQPKNTLPEHCIKLKKYFNNFAYFHANELKYFTTAEDLHSHIIKS